MALALGKTVGELLTSLSADELTEWAAFYRIEPFGEYRKDLRAGIVASTIANVNAQKGKHYSANDFLPKFDKGGERVMTPDETMDWLKGFANG